MKRTGILWALLAAVLFLCLCGCGKQHSETPQPVNSETPEPVNSEAPTPMPEDQPVKAEEPELAYHLREIEGSDYLYAEIALDLECSAGAALSFTLDKPGLEEDDEAYFNGLAEHMLVILEADEAEDFISRGFSGDYGYLTVVPERYKADQDPDFTRAYSIEFRRDRRALHVNYTFRTLDRATADDISEDLMIMTGVDLPADRIMAVDRLFQMLKDPEEARRLCLVCDSDELSMSFTDSGELYSLGVDIARVTPPEPEPVATPEPTPELEPTPEPFRMELLPAALSFAYESVPTAAELKERFYQTFDGMRAVLEPSDCSRIFDVGPLGVDGSLFIDNVTITGNEKLNCNYYVGMNSHESGASVSINANYSFEEYEDWMASAIADDLRERVGIAVPAEDIAEKCRAAQAGPEEVWDGAYIEPISMYLKKMDREGVAHKYEMGFSVELRAEGTAYRTEPVEREEGFSVSGGEEECPQLSVDKDVKLSLLPSAALSFVYDEIYPAAEVEENFDRISDRVLGVLQPRADYEISYWQNTTNGFFQPTGSMSVHHLKRTTENDVICDYHVGIAKGYAALSVSYQFAEWNDRIATAIIRDVHDRVGLDITEEELGAASQMLLSLKKVKGTSRAMVTALNVEDQLSMQFISESDHYDLSFSISQYDDKMH